MSSDHVMYEEHGAIARITLRKRAGPGSVGNVWEALRRAFVAIEASDTVRAALITGAAGAFAFDMSSEAHALPDRYEGVGVEAALSVLWMSRVPVVVALRGRVSGAGALLGFSGDWIVVDDEVEFIALDQVLHRAAGLNPGFGFLPALDMALVSASAAVCAEVSGDEAARLGLVTECVESGAARQTAEVIVKRLAQGPTRALALTRQLLDESANADFEAQCRRELEVNQVLRASRDSAEGVLAFLQKRPARFRGE